jgi:hypothetical protein
MRRHVGWNAAFLIAATGIADRPLLPLRRLAGGVRCGIWVTAGHHVAETNQLGFCS